MTITDDQVQRFLDEMQGRFVGTEEAMNDAVRVAMETALTPVPDEIQEDPRFTLHGVTTGRTDASGELHEETWVRSSEPDMKFTVGGKTYIADIKWESVVREEESLDRFVRSEDEALYSLIENVAVTALGRISVGIFQPGNERTHVGRMDAPDYDYLIMRSGETIGYGELAELMGNAVRAELADRANPRGDDD